MKIRKGIGYLILFHPFDNRMWISRNTVKAWECDFKGAKDLVHKAYKSGAYI